MNLIIDIGNTLAKYYLFNNGQLLSYHHEEDHTLSWLDSLDKKPDAAIISTVVDLPQEAEARLLTMDYPLVRFSSTTPTPLRNLYHTPKTLGPDRLAAAVGAWTQCPGKPILIVDVGSCVTYDFVSARGEYLGGNIAPGLHARLRAIDDYFPRLPLVDAEGDVPEVGYDTETAIRSGVICGMRHELEGYIQAFHKKYRSLLVFLTGGDAKRLAITQTSRTFADDFLVPKGLNATLNAALALD